MKVKCFGMIRDDVSLLSDIVHSIIRFNNGQTEVNDFTEDGGDRGGLYGCNGSLSILVCDSLEACLDSRSKDYESKLIYIHRDLREVCEMYMTRDDASFKEVLSGVGLHNAVRDYNEISSTMVAPLFISYEMLAFNLTKIIVGIARYLDINIDRNNFGKLKGELENISGFFELTRYRNKKLVLGNNRYKLKKVESEEILRVFYNWYVDAHNQLALKNNTKTADENSLPKFYSQNGEDYFLWKFFQEKDSGVFIEVGAFDGVHLSNTYMFENIGWSGVCIEPSNYFHLCVENRPNSKCIRAACVASSSIKELMFYEDELGLLSTLEIDEEKEEDIKSRYETRNLEYNGTTSYKVQCETLNTILENNRITHVDFISIDVEGTEMDVLRGLDLNKYKPEILLIEINAEDDELVDYLTNDNDYFLARKIGVNYVYVRTKEAFFRIQDIDIICYIERQMHPRGASFTPKIYQSGFYVEHGTKRRRMDMPISDSPLVSGKKSNLSLTKFLDLIKRKY